MKKRIKLKIKLILLVIIILLLVSFVSGYFSERVKLYVKQMAITNASQTITNAINENVLDTLTLNNIFKNEEGYLDTKEINKILKEVNQELSKNINNYEYNKVSIPLGIIFSEILFSNSKVGLSIRIKPISSYVTDIESKVEEYGINNSLIQVNVVVKVNIEALIPLNDQVYEVVTHIPIAMIILEGEVPNGIIYTN